MPPKRRPATRKSGLTKSQQRLAVQFRPMACKFALQRWAGLPAWLKRAMPQDEIVTVAMLGLCRAAKWFEPKRGFQFSTYLFWCVRGATSEALRQASKQSGFSMRGHEITNGRPIEYFSDIDLKAEPHSRPDVDAERNETAEHVRAMLGALPARDQRVMRWRYLDGMTLREIGERLGVSKERVRQLCEKGLEKMRREAV